MIKMYRLLILTTLLLTSLPTILFAEAESAYLPREEQKALYEAQQSVGRNEYQKAGQLLQEYLETHPDRPASPLLFYALGNAWYLNGNPGKAYQAYQKGYELYPSSFKLCANLAATAYEIRNYSQAGTLFEKAYRLSRPAKAELLYQAGTAYYQADAFGKARTVLRRLLRTGSEADSSWLQLFVHVCLKLGDRKNAEKVLEKFLNRNPKETEYWRLLYQIRIGRNDHRGAAGALEVLCEIGPGTRKDREELANLYFYLNIPLKGARALEKAYGPGPGPGECEKLSRAYAQAQRPDKAIHYLDMAIRQERTSARLLEKGKLHYERGQWDAAITSLRESLRMNPENRFARLLLGYCAMEKGDITLARESFLKASEGKKYRKEALSALEILKDI